MRAATKKLFARQKFPSCCALGKKRATRRVLPRNLPQVLFLFGILVSLMITSSAQERPSPGAAPSIPKPPAEQPIPFSHKLHLTFDMKCQECHANPEPGDRMTLPTADRCMECHRTIVKEKPAIQKLAEFAKSKQTIQWVRIYIVSGWVFWNHRSHLESGVKCEACHGEVRKMEVLTAATNVTTMAGCVDCHRKNDASTGCEYCHSGK